jgi:hypothetical protein
MAGSISLSMSQQFKLSGALAIPLSGGKLYTLAAGETNTPQNSYQDYGLTIAHPNPIILDEAGRIPAFYLADGFIKIRLVDSDGLTQIEQDNLLVVGPSSGTGGGGGGGVDATTVFATGDVMWQPVSGSRTGWVRDNGRTIGSSTSGATERANADCEALFSFLWNKYSDTFCPVSTGRGVSASADWSANKTIQLLNFQDCVPGGLDDMGNTAAGGFANVPVVSGDATTAGSILGAKATTLVTANLPPYTPAGLLSGTGTTGQSAPRGNPTFAFTGNNGANQRAWSPAIDGSVPDFGPLTVNGNQYTFTGTAQGGTSTPANVVQRTVLGTFYRKL